MVSDNDSTYTLQDFDNEFNPANWSAGTFNYYFEATMKTTGPSTGYAQLYNISDSDAIDALTNSEVSTTNINYERQISADLSGNTDWPSAAKTLDTQIKNSTTETTSVASSWLVIKVSSLQVPELVIWALPLALFLPFVVKKRFFGKRRPAVIGVIDEN